MVFNLVLFLFASHWIITRSTFDYLPWRFWMCCIHYYPLLTLLWTGVVFDSLHATKTLIHFICLFFFLIPSRYCLFRSLTFHRCGVVVNKLGIVPFPSSCFAEWSSEALLTDFPSRCCSLIQLSIFQRCGQVMFTLLFTSLHDSCPFPEATDRFPVRCSSLWPAAH